jgi:hypothetical protein
MGSLAQRAAQGPKKFVAAVLRSAQGSAASDEPQFNNYASRDHLNLRAHLMMACFWIKPFHFFFTFGALTN